MQNFSLNGADVEDFINPVFDIILPRLRKKYEVNGFEYFEDLTISDSVFNPFSITGEIQLALQYKTPNGNAGYDMHTKGIEWDLPEVWLCMDTCDIDEQIKKDLHIDMDNGTLKDKISLRLGSALIELVHDYFKYHQAEIFKK